MNNITTDKHLVVSPSYSGMSADRSVSEHNRDGDVRVDQGKLLVFSGSYWEVYNSSTYMSLSPETEQVIDWAKRKMEEEQQLHNLMDEYPELLEAKLYLEAMVALIKDPSNKEKA